MTTVILLLRLCFLSFNRKKFADWRARVGNEEADRKCKKEPPGTSVSPGERVYLNNDDYESLKITNPLIQLMFKANKADLDNRIGNIYQQETRMYSDKLCLAGTVDLICDVDGELSIVDFKTSEKEKPEEWLEDYFVQLSALLGNVLGGYWSCSQEIGCMACR